MAKYAINDVVFFIAGTGSILPARIKNIITTQLGSPLNYREEYYIDDTFIDDRTVVTYDLGNDLNGVNEDTLFSSAEEAVKSIKV